ncbi:MAG: hypothetical protein HOV67_30280 [Kribbellaceae bacterium]|nr:hypothetical protein [Kribbellaceae bacterium]
MRDIASILQVFAGLVAVPFGPLAIALTLRRRGLNWAGEVYHWAIALVCLTALVLVPYDWARLWYLWPITIASYLFVYFGQRAAESPGGLWYRGVLRGYGGGWVALWTAIAITTLPETPWPWAIPVVVGLPLIEWLCVHPAPHWTRQPQPRG